MAVHLGINETKKGFVLFCFIYNDRKSKSKRKIPSILALFVFIDELMLAHHELALP